MNALDEYQKDAARTMRHKDAFEVEALLLAIGLSGEAGEAANIVKKMVRDDADNATMRTKLAEEIGDTLWQLAALCEAYGLSLSGVALMNVAKLQERYPGGFTPDGGKR
jgi:NTP pyrophosphatase (non-canonical NTP hydrolase)